MAGRIPRRKTCRKSTLLKLKRRKKGKRGKPVLKNKTGKKFKVKTWRLRYRKNCIGICGRKAINAVLKSALSRNGGHYIHKPSRYCHRRNCTHRVNGDTLRPYAVTISRTMSTTNLRCDENKDKETGVKEIGNSEDVEMKYCQSDSLITNLAEIRDVDKPPEIESSDLYTMSNLTLGSDEMLFTSTSNLDVLQQKSSVDDQSDDQQSETDEENRDVNICVLPKHYYMEEDRRWLKYKVETMSKEQCIILSTLGHLMLNEEEMPGSRLYVLSPEDAKQSLLCLALSDHWAVLNLAVIMDYLPKCETSACDLQSSLASKLKQKMLHALFYKELYENDDQKREEVYNKYKHFLVGYSEEDIEWYGLTFDEALRKFKRADTARNSPKPLKLAFRK